MLEMVAWCEKRLDGVTGRNYWLVLGMVGQFQERLDGTRNGWMEFRNGWTEDAKDAEHVETV